MSRARQRAERDMRVRIWAAMDPDHVLEFQALGALEFSSSSGGARKRATCAGNRRCSVGAFGVEASSASSGRLARSYLFCGVDNPFKRAHETTQSSRAGA